MKPFWQPDQLLFIMEVHAHTHTPRKKWTHYLWEFLMLFLAVFCGFLAENQREHMIENQREKQYIHSIIQDLKTDTANISEMLIKFEVIKKGCDSILNSFQDFIRSFKETLFWKVAYGYPDFIYTDRTMQQLKNAGGLRLIRNMNSADSIVNYDAIVKDIFIEQDGINRYWVRINEFADKFMRYRTLYKKGIEESRDIWLTKDENEFDHLYNLLIKYSITIVNYIRQLRNVENSAGRLIVQLQKEYQLK